MKHKADPIKVLIAEKNEEGFNLLTSCLKALAAWHFEITRVEEYSSLLTELKTQKFILCFCDPAIDDAGGSKLISQHQAKHTVSTPLIFFADTADCNAELTALKAGVFDYLVKKDLSREKLETCVKTALDRLDKQRQLPATEKKYSSLFEKFRDVIFIADYEQQIVSINYAIKEILGFEEADCTGKSLLSFFQQPSDAVYFEARLKEDGEIENYEAPLLTADNKVKLCAISASVETDNDDELYLQGTIHDLTNFKKVQRAFLQSEKMAASGRFISTLAHELRNPLNNIKLAAEHLSQVVTDDDDNFFLSIIQRNGERINDLVTELLDSSRPAEIKMEDISIHQLLNNAIDKLQDKLQERHVKVTTHYDMVDAHIKGDPAKLEKAFLNIIENAMEAVADNTGQIKITTVYHNDKINVYINDNGTGISDDNKDKIFEPYFTLKRNGIGLGLATALNILQSHRAKTEVQSQEKEGTVFCIQFIK